MKNIKKELIKKIEQSNKIAIFFHESPDLDALGSSYGLATYLKNKYPKKQIKIVGVDLITKVYGQEIFKFDKTPVSESFLKSALGIVLDTANKQRVQGHNYQLCKDLVRIDHHPKSETFSKIEWIDKDYCAVAEMISEWLFEWDDSFIDKDVATYLYAGLLTDTNRFLYPSVRPSTYIVAAKLFEKGANRIKVHHALYLKELKDVKFNAYILSKAKIDTNLGFAYAILPKNIFKHFNIEDKSSNVYALANIKNVQIWFTFYYDNVLNKWKGSIRSLSLPINQIADKYNGGGHPLASGIRLESKKQIKHVIADIKQYLQKNQFDK